MLVRRLLCLSLLAACGGNQPQEQVVTGNVSATRHALAVRAISESQVVAATPIRRDGSFTIGLAESRSYRLEIVGRDGVVRVLDREGRDLVLTICQAGDPYNIGALDNKCGPNEPGCPDPTPCDPNDPSCPPPPGCDPTDPNCPPPKCDPTTTPNCPCDPNTPGCDPSPCTDPNAPGCPPPPPPCNDPSSPNCCDPTTQDCSPPSCNANDPNCECLPDGSKCWPTPPDCHADGSCPPCADPTDPNSCNDPCAKDPASCGCKADEPNCWPPPSDCSPTDANCDPNGVKPHNIPTNFGCSG